MHSFCRREKADVAWLLKKVNGKRKERNQKKKCIEDGIGMNANLFGTNLLPSIKARSQSTLESQQYLTHVFTPFTLPISVNCPAFSPPASFMLYMISLWGHLSSKLSVFKVLVLLSTSNQK